MTISNEIQEAMDWIQTKTYEFMIVGERKRGKTAVLQVLKSLDSFSQECEKYHIQIKDMMEFEDEEEYNIQNLVNHFEPMDTAIVVSIGSFSIWEYRSRYGRCIIRTKKIKRFDLCDYLYG